MRGRSGHPAVEAAVVEPGRPIPLLERSDRNAARWTRRFEIPMLAVAVLVIPSILLDQPRVAEPWRSVGVAMNWLIWSAFLLELVLMVAVSPKRWSYLRRNPIDLIVVVLTPPFLTSAVNGVRLLRLARVARLVRLAPLVCWMLRSGGLRYATAFAGLVVLAAAEAFSVIENTSYFQGLYWAITTVTTVGYGNPSPTTDEGKVIAMVVMVVGIGFFAALAGALADLFIQGRTEPIAETEREVLTADEALLTKVDALTEQLAELRAALEARMP
jgi:voltage-gated potassium channel